MAASPFAISPAPSSTRQIWRFGLLCVAFTMLWIIGSAYGLGNHSTFDTLLCNQLAATSAWGLRAIGWAASTDVTEHSLLLLNNQPTVIVGPPCDGLVLYTLLAGFVLAYPGPSQRRFWFIPLGIAALWLLNVIRIIVLALNHRYSPETFEFDHHYAFNAIAYGALGGLWLLWTRQAQTGTQPKITATTATLAPAASTPTWLTPSFISGLVMLAILVLISIFRTQVLEVLSTSWAAMLTTGPAWLHRLPGAETGAMPAGISRLALPVGLAYTGFFLVASLLTMRLLLPARNWTMVWRCYAGLGLVCGLLFEAGRLGAGPVAYNSGRMLLDFLVSLLPIAGLLVLLWRPIPTKPALVPAQ